LYFGLYNIRRRKEVDESTGKRPFEAALVSLWSKSTGWEDMEGETLLFRDGSTTFPSTTREVLENNFLSTWVRCFGLVLLGVAWALGFVGILLLWYFRKDAIVQGAQPFFMQLLCGGSILTSTAIFTLSWDEGMGCSDHKLDIACMMTPWFFFVGHIVMFSAMFTKLWRVDKVMQFRRHNKVTVRNVLGPLVALLVATLAILVAWTALDPWTWERVVVSELPYETYGECGNDRLWAFIGPLVGLLIFAESTSAFFAWKTADIPDEFNDSSSIFLTICTHMQAWAIGVPILAVLGNSSSDGTYLGRVLLIWIFSVSSIACVVYPKLAWASRLRRNPELRQTSRVTVSGVFTHTTPSSRRIESHPTNQSSVVLSENE
jgi:gamma-aminobutyric acid type B receptor